MKQKFLEIINWKWKASNAIIELAKQCYINKIDLSLPESAYPSSRANLKTTFFIKAY